LTGARRCSSSRKTPSAARFGCEHLVSVQGAPVAAQGARAGV
ncbi:hypothetical protein A2U01_0073709, partial [Trifolium medium]|nr:hypothetical protein [Trifolium medium]